MPILQPDRPWAWCAVPTGLRQVERGEDWVTVAWNSGEGGEGYRVRVEGALDTLIETTDTVLTLEGLEPEAIHWVMVQRLCRHSCQFHSDTVVAGHFGNRLGVRAGGAAITSVDDNTAASVWPNPATEEATVRCEAGISRVELFDLQGRRLLQSSTSCSEVRLNLSALPAGHYLLRIHTPLGVLRKPLTVR